MNSEEAKAALRVYLEENRIEQKEFAKMIGKSEVTISRWLNGGKPLNEANINAIKFIIWSSSRDKGGGMDAIKGDDVRTDNKVEANAHFLGAKDVKTVPAFPVISMCAAASVNTAYYPLAEYALDNADEWQSFRLGRVGDFVLEVSGDSMNPWYPGGTRLLCRQSKPKNGQRVIAILDSGEIVFKVFAETSDYIYLMSINKNGGTKLSFKKNESCEVRGIYQVIESARDEQALDKAMSEAGIHHFWENELRELEQNEKRNK